MNTSEETSTLENQEGVTAGKRHLSLIAFMHKRPFLSLALTSLIPVGVDVAANNFNPVRLSVAIESIVWPTLCLVAVLHREI